MDAAERLRQALCSLEIEAGNGTIITFSVSIGVTSLHADDTDIAELLKRADTALYSAKQAGRNCVRSNALL